MPESSAKPIDRLLAIMAQLRDRKNGCPWDVEQDFSSIAPHTLEEAYEVADAIERKDMKSLREELGDLLLQVVFHSQMAKEEGIFSFDDVAQGICDKLVSRHPHVFGDAKIATSAEQVQAWEEHKAKEKAAAGASPDDIFGGITLSLPAMTRAIKLQKRAEKLGFDWPQAELIFEKLDEEVRELRHVLDTKGSHDETLEEIGDMIFTCVNLARKLGVDPEEAVRFCNRKFINRVHYMQNQLELKRLNIKSASFQELNDLWDQAKISEHVITKDE